MTLRLRQVALVAGDLDRVVEDLTAVFGLGQPFHDPGVGVFGLRNAVFALGDTFLEVVSPVRDDASAARFLARKRGDAGYMVIVQSDDLARERRRLRNLGVRVVFETQLDDIATLHLHPHDIGGAIVSIDEARPEGSWRWGGPDWQRRRSEHASGIDGAEIACTDPQGTSTRWAHVLGRSEPRAEKEVWTLPLERGVIRFTPCAGPGEEGLVCVDVTVASPERVMALAAARGFRVTSDELTICGTRFRLQRPQPSAPRAA